MGLVVAELILDGFGDDGKVAWRKAIVVHDRLSEDIWSDDRVYTCSFNYQVPVDNIKDTYRSNSIQRYRAFYCDQCPARVE